MKIKKINFGCSGGLSALLLVGLLSFGATSAWADEPEEFHRFWPDNLYAVEFPSDKVGYIAGYSGSLFKTEDAGETWSGIYMGVSELIRKMVFIDEQNGWAVGHRGAILHTSDAGLTWAVQHRDKGTYIRDIAFTDLNNGWAVGHDAAIWHTADGGKHWDKQVLQGYKGRDIPNLHSVIAKDPQTAILVGEFGVVAHTEDAGQTWLITYNKHKGSLLSVANQAEGALAIGPDGGVYRIENATEEQLEEAKDVMAKEFAKKVKKAKKRAKRTRTEYIPLVEIVTPETDVNYGVRQINSGTKEHLYDLAQIGGGDLIAVGVSTMVKISGDSVTSLTAAEKIPLSYIWFGGVAVTPSGSLWAAGINGMILKGNVAKMAYDIKLNIAEPGRVKLISNRWGE